MPCGLEAKWSPVVLPSNNAKEHSISVRNLNRVFQFMKTNFTDEIVCVPDRRMW